MPRPIKAKSPRQSPLKSSTVAITFTPKKISELKEDSNRYEPFNFFIVKTSKAATFYSSVLLPLAFHLFLKLALPSLGEL